MRIIESSIHTSKELMEHLIRFIYSIFKPIHSKDSSIKQVQKEICQKGYCVIENFISEELADELRLEVDAMLDNPASNIWRDEVNSDNRLFFAENKSTRIKDILLDKFINSNREEYTKVNSNKSLVLASRLIHKDNNIGSGGGWHRDTPYSKQFKAVIYLSPVTEKTGPFTYIPFSHKKLNSVKAVWKNIFTVGQYRYTQKEIDIYIKEFGIKPIEIIGKKGTLILVDTKGIHRGAPIQEGSRHTLFNYYWDRKIPKHFEKFIN